MLARVLLLTIVATLVGCANPPLEGKVTRFHSLDVTTRTFSIVPNPDQRESLEFRSYANLVRNQLLARGWRETDFSSADVAVFFQYQISQGRAVNFSYPILGAVPSGISYTTGTFNTFGNTSTLNATTTRQSTLGVVGTGVGSRTEFDRAVRLTMFSAVAYRATSKMERVYEGEIRSAGSTGDLPTVMPALIQGLFQDFPGASGSTRTVAIPIQ